MVFPAPGIGLTMTEVALSLGPDALRAPAGPLPADPRDDADLPPELAGVKAEAERRLGEWVTTGRSLVSSSLYDAGLWYSTGLGDEHTHDAQIGFLVCGYTPDLWRTLFRVDPDEYFEDAAATPGPRRRGRRACSPTRCSRTARARSGSPAPTRWSRRSSR